MSMSKYRKVWKERSNNSSNPNKNICTTAVAKSFGVANDVRYLHTHDDIVRAVRTRFTVRSRMSSVKGTTVGAIRKELAKISKNEIKKGNRPIGFIISVAGHALALNADGTTRVDTDPRKRDKRKVFNIKIVMQ